MVSRQLRISQWRQGLLPVFPYLLFLLLRLPAANADHSHVPYPTNITIRAAVLPGDTFDGFQNDLLEHLTECAKEMDNITLHFQREAVQEVYSANLNLIAPDCHPGETVFVKDEEYPCSDYDMIVGDYWTSPSRYERVDFTPPWLQTSISSLKYLGKTKYPELDVTTFTEASVKGVPVCVRGENTYEGGVMSRMYPDIQLVPCHVDNQHLSADSCISMLKAEECGLWVSDELILRKEQTDDPSLEMTGEHLQRQLLAWPVRKSLDPTIAFLLNKWMYNAISDQAIAELYFEYFEKKKCPIGTAGKNCELPCDPDHGLANAAGKCVCDSTRWVGDDCATEVPIESNLVPPALQAIAYGMFGVNMLVYLLCAVWLYWNRESSQVQVSNPFLLGLILLGCLISSSTIIAMAQEDEGDGPVKACMAIPWLYSVGFSITFGTLVSKILRVYRLFTQDIHVTGRTPVTVLETLKYIAAVLLLDVIILVLWTTLSPLHWVRETVREDVFGYPLESLGYCWSENWQIFTSLIAALHLSLMAIASYMCFCARNIPTKYSEHKFVSIAMISNFQVFLVAAPVLLVLATDPEAMMFVRSVVVWMNDLVVVSLIFGNLIHSVVLSKNGALSVADSKDEIGAAVRRYSFNHGDTSSRGVRRYSFNLGDTSNRGSRKAPPPANDIESNPEPSQSETTHPHEETPAPNTSRRPARVVSSLSMGSAPVEMSPPIIQKRPKSVSFDDNITLSEYEVEEEYNEYDEEAGSQRFVTEGTQGAPLMPRRPSADEKAMKSEADSILQGSVSEITNTTFSQTHQGLGRRHSLDSWFTQTSTITSNHASEATPDREWKTGPVQNSPHMPRRRSLEDFTMDQPTRKPSEFIDESESSYGDDLRQLSPSVVQATEDTMERIDETYRDIQNELLGKTPQTSRTAKQSTGQATCQCQQALKGTASHPPHGTLPSQPVRLVSIAELETGSSDDEAVEEPEREKISSRRSSKSSMEKADSAAPPTKPEREVSTMDLDESGHCSYNAVAVELDSQECSGDSTARLEHTGAPSPTKPTRKAKPSTTIAFNAAVPQREEATKRDSSKDKNSSGGSPRTNAPTKPLRFLSTTDLECDDSTIDEGTSSKLQEPSLQKSVSRGSTGTRASTCSGGSEKVGGQGAPTKPLRFESTFETDSIVECPQHRVSITETAKTLDISYGTTDSEQPQVRRLQGSV